MAGYHFGAAPAIQHFSISRFTGVDFANNPTQVKEFRSPNAQNIMSNLAGKPVKRTGYKSTGRFPERINAIYRLVTDTAEKIIVHSGNSLYEWNMKTGEQKLLRAGLNDERSSAFRFAQKLYILDGKTYLVYGEFEETFMIQPVKDVAYVPTTTVLAHPDGTGGKSMEKANLLTPKRSNSFLVNKDNASATIFQLDGKELGAGSVTAKVLQSDASWKEYTEGNGITVDRAAGKVTFTTAPGQTPVTGRENVMITFYGKDSENYGKIDGCTIFHHYGSNGATDHTFFSGNCKFKNMDWWSAPDDPTYIPDTNYAALGQDSSAIMGYSRMGNYQLVHKEDNDQDQTIFIRTGSLESDPSTGINTIVFPVTGGVPGIGAVSKYAFGTMDTEPVFLSKQGVYAVTNTDVFGDKYAQGRSYYIDPRLIRELNLEQAISINFEGYYYLAVNGKVYMADSRQKSYEKNKPQSTYQYEWYYFTNMPVRVWWEHDDHLYFGTADGNIMKLYKEAEHSATNNIYHDNGAVIEAVWDTPIFSFDTISKYKTLKGLWVMTAPYVRSSIEVYYRAKGSLQMVKSETLDIFDWWDIDFTRFTFITDDSPKIVATNTKLKKFMLVQFRFQNVAKEGFGFYEAEVQYTKGGRYKG